MKYYVGLKSKPNYSLFKSKSNVESLFEFNSLLKYEVHLELGSISKIIIKYM